MKEQCNTPRQRPFRTEWEGDQLLIKDASGALIYPHEMVDLLNAMPSETALSNGAVRGPGVADKGSVQYGDAPDQSSKRCDDKQYCGTCNRDMPSGVYCGRCGRQITAPQSAVAACTDELNGIFNGVLNASSWAECKRRIVHDLAPAVSEIVAAAAVVPSATAERFCPGWHNDPEVRFCKYCGGEIRPTDRTMPTP